MNSRAFVEFFKRPVGRFVFFLVAVGFVVLLAMMRPKQKESVSADGNGPAASPKNKLTTLINNYVPMAKPSPSATKEDRPVAPVLVPPAPIDLYTAKIAPVGAVYAPFGRLIPCELVVTVDSSRIQTPILGLVIEDVWHSGELVIPAGTEVHGLAQVDKSRERVASQNQWTIVWQDGRELKVTGLALDNARDPDGRGWSITDGSAGLRGYVIKSDKLAEVKFFAATFLSGLAAGFQDSTTTQTGLGLTQTLVQGSLKNAALNGVSQTVDQYAQSILQRIRQDGFYVRVPAGTTFYLYVTQTLDESQAQVAGSRAVDLTPSSP
jgi:hypothetical protein